MNSEQEKGWVSYAIFGNYWRHSQFQGDVSTNTNTSASHSAFLVQKKLKILVLVTSALCLICLSLAIYNAVKANKLKPETSSSRTFIPGSQTTTTSLQTTTPLSQTTTTPSETTTSQIPMTTTIAKINLFLPYGAEVGDDSIVSGTAVLTTTFGTQVFGKSLSPNSKITLSGFTAKFTFGEFLSFTIFGGNFVQLEKAYYRKVTDATELRDISCLLNGTEVLEAFVFTWAKFVVDSALADLPVTAQSIVVIGKNLQSYIIRIYDEELPETNGPRDTYFTTDAEEVYYNYESSAKLAGKRIINDIKDAPGTGDNAPEIDENIGCQW